MHIEISSEVKNGLKTNTKNYNEMKTIDNSKNYFVTNRFALS